MVLDADTLIRAGALVTALGALAAALAKAVKWCLRQGKQDEEIRELRRRHSEDMKATREELTLITYGLLACLKGLKEQGCNGPVTEAIGKIEGYLNEKAHE